MNTEDEKRRMQLVGIEILVSLARIRNLEICFGYTNKCLVGLLVKRSEHFSSKKAEI